MNKKCKSCERVYSNDVWFSDDGECSICYRITIIKKQKKKEKTEEGLNKWLGS